MNEIELRLARLRELMKREHLSAFIFPSTDAHQSEYVADHWRGREWISGFNGSAGTAVVTMKSAALWTDSRYFFKNQTSFFRLGRQHLIHSVLPDNCHGPLTQSRRCKQFLDIF